MNFTEHYYFMMLSVFSSKLGDVIFMIVSAFWNLLLWEIRSYSSNHMNKKKECERLLHKINQTYLFSTNFRTFINKELTPTGFVIGKSGYFAFISHQIPDRGEEETYKIILYGWWSIQQLLTKDVECNMEVGEYKIIRCIANNQYMKTTDNYNISHYHINCYKASDMILETYQRDKRGVFFLYGEPGLGKTTTARMVSQKLNATLCLDFEEFTYYYESYITSFDLLSNYVEPTEEHPFVVTIDELEHFLLCETNCFDDDDNKPKKKMALRNKTTKKRWVRLMDTIQEKKHIIFVFTSNKPKSFFDNIDTSLLREYRVSKVFHYTQKDVIVQPFINVVGNRRKKIQ